MVSGYPADESLKSPDNANGLTVAERLSNPRLALMRQPHYSGLDERFKSSPVNWVGKNVQASPPASKEVN